MNESSTSSGATFHKLADLFDSLDITHRQNESLLGAISRFYPTSSPVRSRLKVVSEFDKCVERISMVPLGSTRVISIINRLRNMQESFLQYSGLNSIKDFSDHIRAGDHAELLRSFGDIVDSSVEAPETEIDRNKLLTDTRDILDALAQMELPIYASRVLRLKLYSFLRIFETCAEYGDDEIRRRIKAIYADFCAEFSENDKKYESARETITRWARSAMVPAGLLCLGLTADVATVAGLLTADPKPALLPPPQA